MRILTVWPALTTETCAPNVFRDTTSMREAVHHVEQVVFPANQPLNAINAIQDSSGMERPARVAESPTANHAIRPNYALNAWQGSISSITLVRLPIILLVKNVSITVSNAVTIQSVMFAQMDIIKMAPKSALFVQASFLIA